MLAAITVALSLLCAPVIAQVPSPWVDTKPLSVDTGVTGLKLTLRRLHTTARLMHTTAHPDDEDGGMLTLEARGKGVSTVLMTLTRGEGGQNLIGPEQGEALGVIRTQELLAARKIYGAEQFFTRAIDFGFTKTAQETLDKWGHDKIISDVVWVIRRFRPDVII